MLTGRRPPLPVETTLDVAMTVMVTPDATLKGRPRAAFRNGTRNTPPPMPSNAPSVPAIAPAPTTAAAIPKVTSKLARYPGAMIGGKHRNLTACFTGSSTRDSRTARPSSPAIARTRRWWSIRD